MRDSSGRLRRPTGVLALAVALALLPTAASGETFDTLSVVKEEVTPSNAEVAVRLSEATPLADVDTVVIGRDDEFADSLASGSLQSDSPLLLVPRDGPVPDRVLDELARLAPTRVLLLGGDAALSPAVEEELAAAGYATERRAGASRFETAVAIAATDVAAADTAILARAFPAPGATDATQGFADALAAGGMAAENRWPVLLTESDRLSGPTRAHLAASAVRTVLIMGGTAAISDAVVEDLQSLGIAVERLAGPNRFDTAIAVAARRGASTAADAAQVLLVQGQTEDAWAGGFAAAAHSALFDAPIVLSAENQVPGATLDWLDGAATPMFAVDLDDLPVLTCVVVRSLCEDARVALGLAPSSDLAPLQLLSTGPEGTDVGGAAPAASGDGSVVAFLSSGGVTGSGDGGRHVFVRVQEGADVAFEQIDVRPDGSTAAGQAEHGPSVSADGRFVAFTSFDEQLDAGGAPGGFPGYAYVRDRVAQRTQLVSLDVDGSPIEGRDVDISDDGRYVTYGNAGAIWHHDLQDGVVQQLLDGQGTPFGDLNGIGVPALSGDGSVTVFHTGIALVPGDVNEFEDTYLYDWDARSLEIVSVAGDGSQGNADSGVSGGTSYSSVSADGNRIVFVSSATNLAEGAATPGVARDVFLRDRERGVTLLLNRLADGRVASAADSRAPAISRDGRYAAFSTSADLDGNGDPGCNAWRVDLSSGRSTAVAPEPLAQADNCPPRIDVLDDGSVVFSTQEGLVPEDGQTTETDVYLARAVPA